MTSVRTRSRFYLLMVSMIALLAIIGFTRRYFFPLAGGDFHAPALLHLHGIVTFFWLALLILQSILVFTGRMSWHRSMGMAGISVATILLYTALQVAILLLSRELSEGGPSPREFNATLLSLVLMASILFACAIAMVKRPDVHKRLMLLTAIVILTPALARIIQIIAPSLGRLERNDYAGLASDLLILIPIVHDIRVRGRPHDAYIVSLLGIIAIQLATITFRDSYAWYCATEWIAKLVG